VSTRENCGRSRSIVYASIMRRDHEPPAPRRLVVPVVLAVTIVGTIATAISCTGHRAAPSVDASVQIEPMVDAPFDSPVDAPIDAPVDAPPDTPIA
jgi:hypothetical protein